MVIAPRHFNEIFAEDALACPRCLAPNDTSAAFCVECGAPIGMVATTDPMQTIYSQGFTYRAAVASRPRALVLAGMWLIFFPMAVLPPIVALLKAHREPTEILTAFAFSSVAAGVLFRVTWSYVVQSRGRE